MAREYNSTNLRFSMAVTTQGIWTLTFPDTENTGNLVNLILTQGSVVTQGKLCSCCKRIRTKSSKTLVELLLFWCKYYKSSVVSPGVTLRMMVELNSNSNVTIEIISKTKTKEAIN